MTQHDLQSYRQKLRQLAAGLSGDVSRLREEASGPAGGGADNPTGIPADQIDLAVRGAEEEQALGLLGPEEQVLAEANAALGRIERGTFGRCEGCGRPISRARLEALPYARQCIRCAREAEVGDGS
jgi:RNA polymerase-binding transcription factor DksA